MYVINYYCDVHLLAHFRRHKILQLQIIFGNYVWTNRIFFFFSASATGWPWRRNVVWDVRNSQTTMPNSWPKERRNLRPRRRRWRGADLLVFVTANLAVTAPKSKHLLCYFQNKLRHHSIWFFLFIYFKLYCVQVLELTEFFLFGQCDKLAKKV